MHTESLPEQVRAALRTEWPAFVAEHPRLAAVLDEPLLVEHITRCIADDPEYQQAMRQAEAVGMAAEAGVDLVRRLLRKALCILG
jgi:hypothetical protein